MLAPMHFVDSSISVAFAVAHRAIDSKVGTKNVFGVETDGSGRFGPGAGGTTRSKRRG